MYYLRTRPAVDPIKFTLSAKHQRARFSTVEESAVFAMSDNTTNLEDLNQVKIDFSNIKTPTAQDLLQEENFPQACSLDDPDCLACSA